MDCRSIFSQQIVHCSYGNTRNAATGAGGVWPGSLVRRWHTAFHFFQQLVACSYAICHLAYDQAQTCEGRTLLLQVCRGQHCSPSRACCA